MRINIVGIRGRNHIVAVNFISPGCPDSGYPSVLHQYFIHVLTVLNLHSHIFGPLRHLQAHFMTEFMRNVGTVTHIIRHQHRVDGERKLRKAGADIDPVGRKQIQGLLGKMEGFQNLLRGIACCLYKGFMLQQHLGLAHGMNGQLIH